MMRQTLEELVCSLTMSSEKFDPLSIKSKNAANKASTPTAAKAQRTKPTQAAGMRECDR